MVLRKHHNKLRKTVYKEMLRGINRLQVPKSRFYITKSPMEITYKKYNTTIYFSGSDGIDDTKGIIDEDKPIKLVVLDELTEFFEDGEGEDELANIEATFVRGNKAGFQMIYLYNPPKNPNAPVNLWCKKMEKRPDCIHIHTDYRDVPVRWLGQDLIDTAEAMKAVDPKMYRWTWLGESVGVDELIYYMFSDRHRRQTGRGARAMNGHVYRWGTMASRTQRPIRPAVSTNISVVWMAYRSITIRAGKPESRNHHQSMRLILQTSWNPCKRHMVATSSTCT